MQLHWSRIKVLQSCGIKLWIQLVIWSLEGISTCYWPSGHPTGSRHFSSVSTRAGFSKAAATRSLSFNCLFTKAACCQKDVWGNKRSAANLQVHSDAILVSLGYPLWNAEANFASVAHEWTTLSSSLREILKLLWKHSPINVDIPQWGTVGVNSTMMWLSPNSICSTDTTLSSSRELGCSGSAIERIKSVPIFAIEMTLGVKKA